LNPLVLRPLGLWGHDRLDAELQASPRPLVHQGLSIAYRKDI
jgi:hypothetical protein